MYIEQASRYKSWGGLKKQMNDLLCDSLKGRITYFYTKCRGNEFLREDGKAAICLDGTEIAVFSSSAKNKIQVPNVSSRIAEFVAEGKDVFDVSYKDIASGLLKEKWMIDGALCEEDFVASITIYLKTEITAALCSDNYLLRIFAFLDRRVGKRKLIEMRDEALSYPEWVRQFYEIRCSVEGIAFFSGGKVC